MQNIKLKEETGTLTCDFSQYVFRSIKEKKWAESCLLGPASFSCGLIS